MNEDALGALDGVQVLDLSRVLAGPYCAQLLAEHGASVIKLEAPTGDETRRWGPPFVDGTAAYFNGANRGKANVCVDLRTEAGRRVLETLVAGCDVVIENFKAGTMERWGFGPDDLAARHPRLIYCRISGYPPDGPMGGLPGYDAAIQACVGLMSINGYADRDPLRMGIPLVDLATAWQAFSAIALALYHRSATGAGQRIDLTLFDTGLSLLHPHLSNYLASGRTPQRTGDSHPSIVPYQTFPTPSGPVFVAAPNDPAFRRLCAVLGCPALADDARFRTNADRLVRRDELVGILAELIATWDRETLAHQLLSNGIAAAPVNDVPAALALAEAAGRGLAVAPDGSAGLVPSIRLSASPPHTAGAPRARGADTVAVLADAGFGPDAIAAITYTDAEGAVVAGGPAGP